MFAGVVAVLYPSGLSAGQRKIFAKGLKTNGALVLDYGNTGDGSASPKPSLPNAAQLLMSAARTNNGGSKRKRHEKESNPKGAENGVTTKNGVAAPTHVICSREAFAAGKVSKDMDQILSKYPLSKGGGSVKVVACSWLSESLRLESLQPIRAAELLQTVTRESTQDDDGGGKKRNTNAADKSTSTITATAVEKPVVPTEAGKNKSGMVPSAKGSIAAPHEGAGGTSSSSSAWGSLAQPSGKKAVQGSSKAVSTSKPRNPWSMSKPSAFMSQSDESSAGGGGSSSVGSSRKVGVGAGPGSAKGPGKIAAEPVWRDDDDDDGGRWEELLEGSVLRWLPKGGRRVSTHIVAFDMDGTLIKSKSGSKFSDAVGDWQLVYPNIRSALKAWHEKGYKVAIISNQLGVGKGKVDKCKLKTKVESVLNTLEVPMEVYLACHDDYYRKPRPGCWELLSKKHNGGLEAVPSECLYVGDAAGRPKQGTYKKDFSAGDLKLALNASIPFQTPEQFFMQSSQSLHKDRSLAELGFNPVVFAKNDPAEQLENLSLPNGGVGGGGAAGGVGALELVVLVGPPASGKSTLCKTRLPSHVRVNQDELSSLAKCKKAATAALKEGKSVVIDATNPWKNTRAGWVQLALENKARARSIYLTTSKEVCFHLNAFRGSNPWSAEGDRRIVPDVAIHTWFKQLDPVTIKEGFSEVVRVPFATQKFQTDDELDQKQHKLLTMYLLPK